MDQHRPTLGMTLFPHMMFLYCLCEVDEGGVVLGHPHVRPRQVVELSDHPPLC